MNNFTMLKGLLKSTPKQDIRYYLNAVYLDEHNAVTTDGHILIVVKHNLTVRAPVLLCRNDLEQKLKMFNKKSELIIDADEGVCTINGYSIELVDGRYPDYQRVVNQYKEKEDCSLMGIDLGILSKASTAIKFICDTKTFTAAKITNCGMDRGIKIECDAISAFVSACRL